MEARFKLVIQNLSKFQISVLNNFKYLPFSFTKNVLNVTEDKWKQI